MPRLLIVHHSLTGGAATMAAAALAGARQESGVVTRSLAATQASAGAMLDADGYLFATPENLATMAGAMKDFFDRCYYPLLDRVNGRAYAAMICAGTDGTGAARQLARIVNGWRLREVAPPLILRTGAQTPQAILAPKVLPAADLDRCRELGTAMAAGLADGIF